MGRTYSYSASLRGVPQGSKAPYMATTKTGRKIPIDTNSKTLKPYRAALAEGLENSPQRPPQRIWGKVRVSVLFTFARYKSHYGTDGALRADAPDFPHSKCGDVDKLARASLDAITTAKWWDDDVQVTDLRARKRWGDRDEVSIIVEEL